MDSRATLGRAIKEIRVEMGMTQEALAEKAGLSISTLRHVEQGAIPSPSFQRVAAIAATLGVPLDELAERAGLAVVEVEPGPSGQRLKVRRIRLTAEGADADALRSVKGGDQLSIEASVYLKESGELAVQVSEFRRRRSRRGRAR